MDNLLKSELFKLTKDHSFGTLIFGLMASAIFYVALIYFDNPEEAVAVKDLFTQTALGGNNYIVRLVPSILAGFFISSEYSIGTMKSIGASGNSRFRIYFAKLMIYTLGTVCLALVFPLVLTCAGAVFFGFNEMPELTYFLRTMGLTVLYTAAFASINALVASIFTDSGKTIGFLILFFLLFDSILYLLSQKFALVEMIFNYSIFKLFQEIGVTPFENGELLKFLLVPIVTYLVFGLIGSVVFQKKEIK